MTDAPSRLARIHAALVQVHDCLDCSATLSEWQARFLHSLDRQLHRGRTLTRKQAAALDRVWQQLVGSS
jgi:hypothetical protein